MADHVSMDLEQALISGNLSRIRRLYRAAPHAFDAGVMLRAGELGHWHIVSFLVMEGGPHLAVNHINRNLNTRSYRFESFDGRCSCETHCEAGCSNLEALILCTKRNCSAGPACGNRFKDELPTERFMGDHGIGLRAGVDIARGQFIIEYVGEMRSYDQLINRNYALRVKARQLSGPERTVYIDAYRAGNNSRFVNHSCEDHNCVMQEFVYKRTRRMGLFAARNIRVGDELRFQYAPRDELPFVCKCASCG